MQTEYLEQVIAAIRNAPQSVLLALDFDGTLAPIVADPKKAFAEPAAIDALALLGSRIGTTAIVTGRPVETVLDLANISARRGFEELIVLGQYGAERWTESSGATELIPAPVNLDVVEEQIKEILNSLDLANAHIEHKGRALVVHTRRLPNQQEAFSLLAEPLKNLAAVHNLVAEPGKFVWEIRDGSVDKGKALSNLIAEVKPLVVVFVGDDLGDLPAFSVVQDFREQGGLGLLVCSSSTEETALAELADVVVDGPIGVAIWLAELAAELGS